MKEYIQVQRERTLEEDKSDVKDIASNYLDLATYELTQTAISVAATKCTFGGTKAGKSSRTNRKYCRKENERIATSHTRAEKVWCDTIVLGSQE